MTQLMHAGPVVHPDAITFSLYAPYKNTVSVVGNFNDWDPNVDPLEPDSDGNWTLRKELPPDNYTYQYVVDGTTICDPYAREIVWPHAEVRQEQPTGFIALGLEPYHWRHQEWRRPLFHDLIIMELHVADFSPEGTFNAVTTRLDYLKNLGVNALELMPVCEGARPWEWGYRTVGFFACRCEYGRAADFKELVDEAHARGIAIILDVVLTHTDQTHPFMLMYPIEESPWYSPSIHNEFKMPGLDHRKPATQQFIQQVQEYWLHEFRVDGFRYDYAKSLTAQGPDIMGNLVHQARTSPGCYLIGEYVPEEPQAISQFEMNAAWHPTSSHALKALTMQGVNMKYSWADNFEECVRVFDHHAIGYQYASQMINFVESHDEQRFILDARLAGYDGAGARPRLALAATVLMAAPGVPMLYHGQEFGDSSCRSANERNPIRWELLATEGGKGLMDHYQRLCAIRHAHPALRSETYSFDTIHSDEKWFVLHRWSDGDHAVIAANFSGERRSVSVTFPQAARWHDPICNLTLDTSTPNETHEIRLDQNQAAIFLKSL